MNKKEIESFLIAKQGYLKKSPIEVAKVLWKNSNKHTLPKNKQELEKELKQIKDIQVILRKAKSVVEEDTNNEILDIYHKIIEEKNKPKKRLFFDIETSPNIVYSWRVGRKITIDHENIIKERAIICIGYKWEGEKNAHVISWGNQNDYALLSRFTDIINSADEIVTHNGDNFDIKHLRARCIFHGIPLNPKFNSIDTLKLSRVGFNFNSNKLAYIAKFLGLGEKLDTGGFSLWKDVLNGDSKALNKMIEYCRHDVELLEEVYNKLKEFTPVKKFKYGT